MIHRVLRTIRNAILHKPAPSRHIRLVQTNGRFRPDAGWPY